MIKTGYMVEDGRRGHPRFHELLDTIRDLHDRKNSNYASGSDPLSNFKLSTEFGIEPWKGALVRMSDKWSRIVQLANGTPDAVGESLTDTLMDLAVYSLLTIVLMEERLDNQP